MESRPLAVLLVSQDRALLRCLGRFLGIFGFDVLPVAEPRQVAPARAARRPDFVLLDADPSLPDALETARSAGPGGQRETTYQFLLARRLSAGELRAACEAGIDDVLSKPLVHGELLARLRAGARELELDRRLCQQSGVDPLTRLTGRQAFPAVVEKALAAAPPDAPVACALLALDFFLRAERDAGRSAAEAVLCAAADRLRELGTDAGDLAAWGEGQFAAVLPGRSESEAAAWGERLRAEFAATEIACGAQPTQFTLSVGVAAGNRDAGATADGLLQAAGEALRAAQASGHNAVVGQSALEGHRRAWAEFAAADKLFARTVARDVMTPFPVTLRAETSLDLATELLRQSRLNSLPTVDDEGRLLGLVVGAGAHDAGPSTDAPAVRRVPGGEVATYDEGTDFRTLREFLTRDPRAPVVITCRGRPTGFVTPENLAALGCRLTEGSFAPAVPYSAGADYLVVPDVVPTAEA